MPVKDLAGTGEYSHAARIPDNQRYAEQEKDKRQKAKRPTGQRWRHEGGCDIFQLINKPFDVKYLCNIFKIIIR